MLTLKLGLGLRDTGECVCVSAAVFWWQYWCSIYVTRMCLITV